MFILPRLNWAGFKTLSNGADAVPEAGCSSLLGLSIFAIKEIRFGLWKIMP